MGCCAARPPASHQDANITLAAVSSTSGDSPALATTHSRFQAWGVRTAVGLVLVPFLSFPKFSPFFYTAHLSLTRSLPPP